MWGSYSAGGASRPKAGNLPTTLQDYAAYIQQFPGAAPGGSGYTGLSPGDRLGFEHLRKLGQAYTQAGGSVPAFRSAGRRPGTALRSAGQGGSQMDPMSALRGLLRRPISESENYENLYRNLGGLRDVQDEMEVRRTGPHTPTGDLREANALEYGEDVKDYQQQRGAERFFAPEADRMRRVGQAGEEALARLRYLQPAQIEAGWQGDRTRGEALGTAAKLAQQHEAAVGEQQVNLVDTLGVKDPTPEQAAALQGLLQMLSRRFGFSLGTESGG